MKRVRWLVLFGLLGIIAQDADACFRRLRARRESRQAVQVQHDRSLADGFVRR